MFANQRSKIFLTVMLVMIAACLAVTQVFGMGITEPSPRIHGENGENDDMGTGPCGEAAKGPTTVTYTAGDSITVKWDIDEEHTSGKVSFFLMDSDTDEEPYPLADIDIESDEYEANLTLPDDVTCDNCTLQWVFTPAVEEGDEEMSLYQCADIEITQKDPSTGGGGGGGGSGDGNGNGGGGGGTVDSGADTLYSLAPWALAALGAFVINILS